MSRYIQKIVLLLLLFISQFTYSQIYPVQAVPVVLSPYSSKLSDYSNPMVNRINLQLITTDLLVTNRPALLFVKIQGNGITAQSAPVLSGINPIYLNGGEILSLTSADIAGYFRFQNLQGLTTTRYSDPLPDGVYTICFQVYDLMTKKWLSQNSCATVYLMLNDPPQLNLPSNNEQIPSTDFPNIVFSWTPRHLNATNVSYEFELKEILNTSLDPAFAFEVSPLLLKEENLRTSTLLYDVSKPTLIPGKTYAWRVKAVSTNGLAENAVFKNNGYSQVFSFKYTANCSAPRFLLSEQQSRSGVKLMWQGENSHKKYHVQYRKANVENAEWFEVHTINTQTLLQGLEAGFTYEFRVGASCEMEQYGTPQSFVYSGIQTFTINKEENATSYNCGIVPKIEITNQQPLGAMVVHETFMAGDFPVKVLDVTGSNGIFSGSGYIQVPYLFDTRIGVEFNNVRINSDYQLIDGVVETTYDPDWSNVEDVDEFIDDLVNLIDKIRDKLKNGEQLTEQEVTEFTFLGSDYYDNLNNQIDEQLAEGTITQEEADDLKKLVNESQEAFNNSLIASTDKSTVAQALQASNTAYDKADEIKNALAGLKTGFVLFSSGEFEENESSFEIQSDQIISDCYNIFLSSGRLVKFDPDELAKISKISISNSGYLQYVIGKDNNKYNLSRKVETKKVGNKTEITKTFESDELVCFDCIKKDKPTTIKIIETEQGTVYEGNTDQYRIANFISTITCVEGLQVMYKVSDNVIGCRTITKEDCENFGAGEGTGEIVFSQKEGKYNITVRQKDGVFSSKFELTGKGNSKIPSSQKTGIEQEVQNSINDVLKDLNNPKDINSLSKKTKVNDFGFYVAQMTGKEWITTLSDLGTNVWEQAALPENYWNEDKGSKTNNVRMPALFTGVSDGVISEVTEYPQLIKLGYDVATKKEVRTGLWESVKGISVETIKDAAVDFYEEKKANYTSDKSYIVNHTVGKDGVQVASILFGGGGIKAIVKNVDEGVDNVGKKVKDAIQKKLDDIDEFMKTPDFKNLLDDAWKRYKGKLSREKWEERYKTLYKNKGKGKIAEDTFNDLMGADAIQLEIQVGNSKRYVDNVLNGTAREIKSGKVSWSAYKDQVLKDIDIVKAQLKDISKVEWHCFDGVDQSFIDNVKTELQKAGLSEADFKIIKY